MALIHWWPLTENTDDYIDGSHKQTVMALPSNLKDEGISKRAGKVSINTFDFNGIGSLIDTGIQQSSLGNNWTISAWLLADSNSNYRGAIGRHNNGGIGGFIFGGFNNGNFTFGLTGRDPSSGSAVGNGGVRTSLPLSAWTHFTMVVKEGKTIQVYKNGELVGTNSLSINWNPIGTILIGMSYSSSDRYWDGAIQDIRIYDEPLSPKEIKKLAQGLIIHYNPDNILGYNLLNSYDKYTKDNPFTSNLANRDGISTLSIGCDVVNGKTYTLSADMDGTVTDTHMHNEGIDKRSCSIWLYFRIKTWAEGAYWTYKTPICYTRTSPHFRRISKTRYAWTFAAPTDTEIKSCSIRVNTYSDGTHPVTVHFWNFKLEEGDVATPFSLNREGQALDSSGFGYDGTIVSETIEKSTDHKYKKNIVADGNWEHHIRSDINPSFLTSGVTLNVWHKNVTKKDFLLANGQDHGWYAAAMHGGSKWSNNVDGDQFYYIDGEPYTSAPKDGQWHMYTFTCAGLSKWTELYWSRHAGSDGNAWSYNGPLGDIRLYATALSAADVKNLYNETRVTHPMQFLISNSSALSSLTSSNPVLADGELVVVRSTDTDGKTCFNIRKGNGVNNFNSLPWKQIKEATLKGWRSSFTSDSAALDPDTGSYTQLGGALIDKDGNKYYPVDYIENTSDSFIQTDYLPRTSVTEMEVQFRKIGTRNSWSPIVNAENDIRFGIMCSTGGNNDTFACWIGSSSNWAYDNINLGTTFYQKNTFKISHEGFYINGTKIYTPSSSAIGDYTASWGICVGARQTGESPTYSGERTFGRWYLVKFSENGKIVRNYIPVKSKSGVYGLFDTVNNKFFSSKSSHGFIGGFEGV